MSITRKKGRFIGSEEAVEVEKVLQLMVNDDSYVTETSYSTNSELYPDNQIPFVDKHMNYLNAHPSTDPKQYVSNLRLMTRVR